jgi:type II secretory pathway component PulF
VQNANVAHVTRKLADQVESGKSLAASMQADHQVPAMLIPLVRTGEENGELPAALTLIHELLEGQIQLRSRLLMVVLPPLVFLLIAIVVIAILVGLLFPLVSLITNLS